ncbi:plasmid partitioning protein RepB [Frigidibacter sp. MR17.24]|uniref:plasmid partitioning protein RepB n=1 Tax=Frigidibacter sp. MR17.24 TaxID=3127345 RepID=UPI003012A2C6
MARKGLFTPDILPAADTPAPASAPKLMPRGAVGALQSSLSRMQTNAVQEIAPELIEDAGVEDRLGIDPEADAQLVASMRAYGQQVPVLLRPHPSKEGRYQIVYGRRRLRALREIGQPVKAMVRQLDDGALVMAQGQENTARQDLSFIEKASFAAQLSALGYDRQTTCDALSIDQPMLSRMLKVGQAFAIDFLRQIGPAPAIGRDRWRDLVAALEAPGARERVHAFMRGPDFVRLASDARFEAVLARARAKGRAAAVAPEARTLRGDDGRALAELRQGARGVTLNVPARGAEGFDRWLGEHAEALVRELHDRFRAEGPGDA